ncbi:MAG: S41 family peptidase [Alphaproteobacteria bacterium]|nr:S41 family peptidase [Alphaproteobacteria bacterium]MBO4644594.1 S41 family peptidase [Alphaproteobacteria bacterium]
MKRFSLTVAMTLLAFSFSDQTLAKETAKKEENKAEQAASVYKYLNVFSETLKRAKTDYVEEVKEDKLIEYAINGMLSSLDPHSSYLDADTFKDMREQTKGEFGGLGIEVTMDNGWIKVISPIDDTPAFKAGIQAGDYITHIDGTTVLGETLTQAVEKMRGPVKSKVKLTIRRKNKEPFDVTITRDNIKIRSVKTEEKDPSVGYIRISSFSETTTDDLKKTFAKIQKDNPEGLVGYILDLRNNPGGLLDQAVSVADLFLDEGEIVSTRPRRAEEMQRYNATKGDITKNKPIVVLINEGSASAAEIVAGALQDHKRAVIVGMRSFGKGSVQTVIPVTGFGAIRLTTARYYTPSGRSIQAKGIEPDIEIPPGHVEYYALRSDDFAEATLPNALAKQDEDKAGISKNKTLKDKKTKKKKEKEPDPFEEKPKEEKKPEDYQLDRAIDIVKAMGIYQSR